MKSRVAWAWLAAALLGLAACTASSSPPPPPPVAARYDEVHEGMSVEEVRALVGEPRTQHAEEDGTAVHEYVHDYGVETVTVYELRYREGKLIGKSKRGI
jgi:hypothetical protein